MQYFVMEPGILMATLALLGSPVAQESGQRFWLNPDSADRTAIVEFRQCVDAKENRRRDDRTRHLNSKKNYQGVAQIKNNVLHRYFYGNEDTLSRFEEMTQVASIPSECNFQ